VAPGDVVWDVGANVGHYTTQFLSRGARNVVCFEPAPQAIDALERRFVHRGSGGRSVNIVPVALSNARGTARFAIEGASPMNRITDAGVTESTLDIPILSGDKALAEYRLAPPNVIKIDVEGHELEVIEGLEGVLALPTVRAVFVEVHFSLLHARGLDGAPARIVATLNAHGFSVRWLDPSHLSAVRTARS
jgi:FkbM family methyltransferase